MEAAPSFLKSEYRMQLVVVPALLVLVLLQPVLAAPVPTQEMASSKPTKPKPYARTPHHVLTHGGLVRLEPPYFVVSHAHERTQTHTHTNIHAYGTRDRPGAETKHYNDMPLPKLIEGSLRKLSRGQWARTHTHARTHMHTHTCTCERARTNTHAHAT